MTFRPQAAIPASSGGPSPPPPPGGMGAVAAQTASPLPTMSMQHQQQINALRLEAELDRTRMQAAHNYSMAAAGAQVADMLAKQHMQQPQHHYSVIYGGAPNINPAPPPAPVIMKDNTAELARIAQLELANTTLHDQSMRQGTSFHATIERMKGENSTAWSAQLTSELRSKNIEAAAQAAEQRRVGERERSPRGGRKVPKPDLSDFTRRKPMGRGPRKYRQHAQNKWRQCRQKMGRGPVVRSTKTEEQEWRWRPQRSKTRAKAHGARPQE